MKAVLSTRVRFGPFELDLKTGELRKSSRTVLLQEQPLRVLQIIVERDGDLVTRQEIQRKLWPNDTVVDFDHGINTAIKKIRQALGDSADNPKYIQTVARRGYRIMVPIEWVDATREAAPPETDQKPVKPLATGELTGKRVSHYRVLEILGGGGMGIVYKAEDLKLGRLVALKFLPEELGGDLKAKERFEREARAASALDHPNICSIYEFGEHEERPFIVMQLLAGRSLRDLLADSSHQPPFAIGELLDLAIQIAAGLGAAHEKGIIHRDIKPANIFITDRSEAKILDFGVAKILDLAESDPDNNLAPDGPPTESHAFKTDHLTRTGTALGTEGYMSPEQIRGEKLDARTDLFSFGLVLYEMTTGRRAFSGDTAEILHDAILHQMPVPARELNPEIPPRLDAIISKCLAKEPQQRYQSANEVIEALEELRDATSRDEVLRAPRWKRWLIPIAAVTSLALLGIALAIKTGRIRTSLFGSNRVRFGSVAVLPLENLTGDPGQEYFVDGMTDELTTDLAQIPSLRVPSRTSTMELKSTKKPLSEIAQDLNVDAVVEGSVTRSGDRVRISAQLIEAHGDRHLWAKSYEGESRDVIALQDDLTRDVADQIRVSLGADESKRLAEKHPVDPPAYEAYLRGRYLWNQRTEADSHKALEYFEQSIAKDPGFAPAYAGLADTYFYLSYAWGHMPPREGMPLAKAAALKAIALDDTNAEGYASMGTAKFVYDWDFPGAERELKHAIALDPNYERSHHVYAVLLAAEGRHDESVAEARKAVEVDPLSVPAANILANMLEKADRCDEAIAVTRKALELDPNPTHVALLYEHLVTCYRKKGETKEAFEEELRWRAAQGASAKEIAGLQQTYAHSGFKGIWQEDLQKMLKRWDTDHWHGDAFWIADLYARLGDLDSAFAWIDRCIDLRSTLLIWIYINDYPSLRQDPRFEEVKRKMGVHI